MKSIKVIEPELDSESAIYTPKKQKKAEDSDKKSLMMEISEVKPEDGPADVNSEDGTRKEII